MIWPVLAVVSLAFSVGVLLTGAPVSLGVLAVTIDALQVARAVHSWRRR